MALHSYGLTEVWPYIVTVQIPVAKSRAAAVASSSIVMARIVMAYIGMAAPSYGPNSSGNVKSGGRGKLKYVNALQRISCGVYRFALLTLWSGYLFLTTFRRTPTANAEGLDRIGGQRRKGLGEARL